MGAHLGRGLYGRELYNHACYCSPTDPRRHPVSAIPDQYLTPMFFILENNNTYSEASVALAVANELQWRLRRGWELNFELDSLSTSEKRAYDAAHLWPTLWVLSTEAAPPTLWVLNTEAAQAHTRAAQSGSGSTTIQRRRRVVALRDRELELTVG